MESKRQKTLLGCLAGWVVLSIVLYIIVPSVIYRCEMKAAMITQTGDEADEKMIIVAGRELNGSFYVNGNLVPEKAVVRGESQQYALFEWNEENKGEENVVIRCQSNVPFIGSRDVLEVVGNKGHDMPSIDLSDELEGYYGEKENMQENFAGYLDVLAKFPYRIYISIRDEGTGAVGDEQMNCLRRLGLETDLKDKYRWSYIGVFEKGESLYEDTSETELLLYRDEYAAVASGGLSIGNLAYIDICGREVAVNSRGMNLVVYDAENNRVVESAAIDTCADLMITRLECEEKNSVD